MRPDVSLRPIFLVFDSFHARLRPAVKRTVLLVALGATLCCGQEPPTEVQAAPAGVVTQGPNAPTRQEAIRALVRQIRSLSARSAEKEAEMAAATSDPERAALFDETQDLDKQTEAARLRLLEIVASDVDLSAFESVAEKPFSLQSAMEDLVEPLIEEIKQLTEDSREARALRADFDAATERGALIARALDALDRTIAETNDPGIVAVLQDLRTSFGARYENTRNEISVLGYRLDEIDRKKQTLVGETRGLIASFFRERGRNLLLALLAAGVVFVGLRFFHRHLHEHTAFFRQGRTFGVRVVDLALAIFTFVGALLAASIVLLVAGDWVLMSLIVLLVLVAVLLAKDALPGFMDEARMLLNLGPVREGERIVYQGVPWLVENLTFFTTLRNPALHGMVRMPIAQLSGMLSRPEQEAEPYFPCEEKDWVVLDDGVYGRVVFQSVEMIRLVLLGGALKTYPTGEFLEQNPRNLSHGYRVTTPLGIDYAHQATCTTDTLERLRAFFDHAISGVVPREQIRSLKIEFALANTSSLDYTILLDVNGALASRKNVLERALQRIAVDACNALGLGIPFQQVTIHQGSGSAGLNEDGFPLPI